ncbi:oxidoreductase [Microlunatus flavus]|uniref:Short-chain dehydrogenase n=1 Tax=Microlunatus flavus TaxID=1036181 RepID=A0A1H9IZV3_9ACTN|nr:oxidoreductase [Microlunatus flavus]SEQ80048.1 Short-chain dehydrogenase [Microlunatus flavus]
MTFSLPLPDLHDRTFVVTGATSGIGQATAAALAGAGAHVVLAVRDAAKGERVAATLGGDTEVRALDLADLSSVRSFAAGWDFPIDVLINNAGVSVPERRVSADGYELQLATNHLGPFALTNLLLPHVTGRVVTLASLAERAARLDLDDLQRERTPYKEFGVYAGTKLANLLFTAELQRRLHAVGSPVRAMAAHPGFVSTNIGQEGGPVARAMTRLLAQSPADGALPVLHAALADLPGDSFSGPQHLLHMRGGAEVIARSGKAKDAAVAARLWSLSEELTGTRFPLGATEETAAPEV